MDYKKLENCVLGEKIEIPLMITRILDGNTYPLRVLVRDETKELRCNIKVDDEKPIESGSIILAKGVLTDPFKIDTYEILENEKAIDYLPKSERPIEDIMKEIEEITSKEITSQEGKLLNDYFFRNEHFLEKFKNAIGGVSNHHNYIGGLAEHTLGVMYLAKELAYRYDARYKEIAILGAKLHDIGKVYEMSYEGPFSYTLKGNMQGHIVMGITMVEKAFMEYPNVFTEEFKERIKGIIVQHHGKLEYGSPVQPRSEESYIVHYADYVDATMNKIKIIGKGVEKGEWSSYDKRIEGRLFL